MDANHQRFLQAFEALPNLRRRVGDVLRSLPQDVLHDFYSDQTFQVMVEQVVPGRGSQMFMSLPASGQGVSRCVVLRKKLDTASEQFARYIIAHEFAHAYLRNGGWGDIQDKELAADALAASWGFSRPATWFAR